MSQRVKKAQRRRNQEERFQSAVNKQRELLAYIKEHGELPPEEIDRRLDAAMTTLEKAEELLRKFEGK